MKKSILFIYGPLNGGGAEIVLLDVLRNFDYSKYNVNLLLIVNGGTLFDRIPKQVNLYSLWDSYSVGYKIACRLSKWFGIDLFIKQRYRRLALPKADVAISFLEGLPLRFHYILQPGVKNISWVHCDLLKQHYTKDVFRKGEEIAAYNSMDEVINVSQDAEIAFLQRFLSLTTVHSVIYNPVDTPNIKTKALCSNGKIETTDLIIVGRLTEPKRVDRAIRLIKRLKDNGHNVTLRIVGDGELKGELLSLCAELNISGLVTFEGYQENPYKFIAKAKILLSTSDCEGFGLVICEAMALGIPVISTKTAGSMEIISNNTYGLLCDFDDESIYKTVKKLLDDSQLSAHYAEQGKKRAANFSVTKAMDRIYKLIL